jgi:hypothetical protein
MKANVVLINKTRGMVAARECDENTWVILEILDDEPPEMDDLISHPDFESKGGETYRNLTQDRDFEVYVQNVVWTEDAAHAQCFLPKKQG